VQFLTYSPGQVVTFFLETVDSDGIRADGYLIDGYVLPVVTQILKPDGYAIDGYAYNMTKIETGVYRYQFTLPKGSVAVGSYLADVTYLDPKDLVFRQTLYQIIVTAPFGNYSISTG
jgi:hypothetical protein